MLRLIIKKNVIVIEIICELFKILSEDFDFMETGTKKQQQIEIIEEQDSDITLASRVVLFNDDWHTFDEVIAQLMKAINCTYEQGRAFAFEVHVKGKAIVFSGSLKNCLKVTSILEEIALHTQIIT